MSSIPNERGWQEIRVDIALTCLAVLAVALRFFTRLKKGTKIGTDDWLALSGLVFLLALFIELLLCE